MKRIDPYSLIVNQARKGKGRNAVEWGRGGWLKVKVRQDVVGWGLGHDENTWCRSTLLYSLFEHFEGSRCNYLFVFQPYVQLFVGGQSPKARGQPCFPLL